MSELDEQTKGVRFRHLDDEKWQEVRALELPGGRVSVKEKWFEVRSNVVLQDRKGALCTISL